MDEEDFNFYRLWKIGNSASLPALKELFEILWRKGFPEIPWTKDEASVNHFEEKEDKNFQKSTKTLPNKERNRKNQRRVQRQSAFRDSNWSQYVWDIGKVVHALVDSKLFDLTVSDEDGVQVSEHIVKIKNIRNETAHSDQSNYNTEYFERTVEALRIHIKALELAGIDASHYINELQTVYTQRPPADGQELLKLQEECEKMKVIQQINEEKEKRFILLEKKITDNETFNAKFEKLESEKDALIEQIDDIKTKHLAEIMGLKSDNSNLKDEIVEWNKKYSKDFQDLKSYYGHLENVFDDLNKKHSEKLGSLQFENIYLKSIIDSVHTMHVDELGTLRSQIKILTQSVEGMGRQTNDSPNQMLEDMGDIPEIQRFHTLGWYIACAVVFLSFLPTAGSPATVKIK